ncbi:hypothetical protein AJ80_08083 [Polytolypa hystricis UAMH7299]|uniref:BZIP domain-containing protein n=1 Tax=Polytolypa hystricis (strain UAMH7299) TaxID=1447883 RepID=A0A2B7XDV8_POLH7|nr:hypothetical protein AJ80_08083 [Polytolypa hystricis UAMH7299]
MPSRTNFYPARPLKNLAAAPPSLLSKGFNPEFLDLARLDKGTHRDMLLPYQPNNHPDRTPSVPPAMQTEATRPGLRKCQLLPAPQTKPKLSLDDEINQALPFFQYPSCTNFPNEHDRTQRPVQEFNFDEAGSHHSDLSSSKSSPSRHSFRRDEAHKREKHLERNRTAASKSRQKKKHETDQLKTRFNEVSRKKELLEEEAKRLHSELLDLKDQILMHSRCDDKAIHIYLGCMVKQATKHGSMSSISIQEEVARSESLPKNKGTILPG